MSEEELRELGERVRDAELVLVGLGEYFQYDWNALTGDKRYQEIEAEIGNNQEYLWIIPFLQKMILRQSGDNRWNRAYKNLEKMLAGKNYFIISLCMDDYIYNTGLEENRIVTPCGGFRKMQCDNNCSHELSDIPQESYDAVLRYYRKELPVDALREPTCPLCGSKLRFNQLGVTQYAEEGYLGRWGDYTKWLQGTVNKRLCVLELGVGMEYPTIIRFPFEKIVFYNQKAFLYRIHPSLYQIGEEIGGRGYSVKENPVDFLLHE
ncbi:MAG: hypothetical protein J1F42_07390 [Lachnospiraceae bacterium]|nr:hypothetical protein [Lachnospiraceae bacterium]